jgi:hypothetical protein
VALALSGGVAPGADLPEIQKRGALRVLVSPDEAPEAPGRIVRSEGRVASRTIRASLNGRG